MLGSIAFGMVFALLGGFVAAWLARRRPLAHGVAVAGVLALGAGISLLSTRGKGAVWSQVAALVLMAPCAVLGGWLRLRQVDGA
jgi:peptidoglycan/LPS O-acetylase OafA/YrhL